MSIDDGWACSGDIYVGVPTIAPVSPTLRSVRSDSVALATPKSMTLGVGRPSIGDHHVGRLEVAVDDPLLMGMLSLANHHEQPQPISPGAGAVAVIREGQAVDQFHHKERLAGLGGAPS